MGRVINRRIPPLKDGTNLGQVFPAKGGFSGFRIRHLGRFVPAGLWKMLRLSALSLAVAGLMSFGCGTHAILQITAPPNVAANSPFTITVTAMVGASRDTIINSAIHFTSSDPAAILPGGYSFTASDAGSHTFTNGVTLMTLGKQSITATVSGAPGINGTAEVTVTSANAARESTASDASIATGQPGSTP